MGFDKNDYPGIPYENIDPNQGIDESSEKNTEVPDVPLAFSKISTLGNFYWISDGDCFSRVAYSGANTGGSKSNTHFQGIIRHHDGNHLVVSGGDSVKSTAQIFLVGLQSKLERVNADTSNLSTYEKGVINRDHLGYNSILYNSIPTEEKVYHIVKVNDIISDNDEQGFWHAGGISSLRNIYVVPLESNTCSKIRFFYFSANTSFLHLNTAEIDRPVNGDKAGASAICRLKNNRYLVAVWQDGNRNGTQNIDFYLSRSTAISDGFLPPVRWFYRDCLSSDNINITYQNIHFVTQENGKLYLVGSENKSNAAPKVKGDDVIELLEVGFDVNIHGDNVQNNFTPEIRLINKKLIDSSVYYNFDAGASIYINKQKELILYTVYHYLRDGGMRMVEFPTGLEPSRATPGNVHFSRIEMFEDENFGGRVLRLYGDIQAEIGKTGDLFLEGKKFNKGFRSIKFQLPVDTTYSIYKDNHFNGEFKLHGDGLMHSIAKVANINGFGTEIKSGKFTQADGIPI